MLEFVKEKEKGEGKTQHSKMAFCSQFQLFRFSF